MIDDLFTVVDTMGDDTTVVNAARVSMGRRVDTMSDADTRLIAYLAKHKHTSPFYHPKMSARVKVPIFIARQWMRHVVGMEYNEISGRYVEFEPDYWRPVEWRKAAPNVKQGSSNEVFGAGTAVIIGRVYERAVLTAFEAYASMLETGVCKEQARAVLPLATFTEFVVTGSLYAWLNFWRQRVDTHAQYEIRQYADVVDAVMGAQFPVSWAALKEYN